MKYIRLEFTKSFELLTQTQVEMYLSQIIHWHHETPKQWQPDYIPTPEDLNETLVRINNTQPQNLFLALALNQDEVLQGFIWGQRQDDPNSNAMIMSLYTTEQYRNKGVATHLKVMMETWCKREGIKTIETTVHYKNKRMLDLNKKLGYTGEMIHMTKKIK